MEPESMATKKVGPDPWASTPNAKRHRKPIEVTLSDDEQARMRGIASENGDLPLSRVVAAGIFVLSEMPKGERTAAIAESVERTPRRGATRRTAAR